jgi:hypothetical protein
MKKHLKLFIFTEFCPDYTDGLAFAIAKDEVEAKKLILKDRGIEVYEWGSLEIVSLNKKIARCVSGGG